MRASLWAYNLGSYGQSNIAPAVKGITIDSNIKTEVEKYIAPSSFGATLGKFLIYENTMLMELYENDSLIASTQKQDKRSMVFKSFYFWRGDTLHIDGAYGLWGGSGFTIKIVKGKATLYHMLAVDETPAYTIEEKDSLKDRIEVPCTDTRILLSEMPDATKKQMVYGYVEFKSGNYYVTNGFEDGIESLPRKKQRCNMKIYFKSIHIDL